MILLLLLLLLVGPSEALAQTEVSVPLTWKGFTGERTVMLRATEYTPPGPGPFPAIVLSHGAPGTAQERAGYTATLSVASGVFVEWGFVVLNPVRRGYGKTGGTYEEDYGQCSNPFFAEAGRESAKDIAAAVAYLRSRPNVDADRIVLVGQSAGGWGSLAAASRGDLPIRGVVNFAGGRGGKQKGISNNNCAPDRLVAAARTFGKTSKVPTLWLYTENDQYFAPELSGRMRAAYTEAGGQATYHLLPAIGTDGHQLMSMRDGVELWAARVQAFFHDLGMFPAR